MNENGTFIKRIGLVGFTNILLALGALVLLPLLTKNLPIEEYGIWPQLTVAASLLPGILTMGLPLTLVRYLPAATISEIRDMYYSFFTLIFLSSLIVSFVIQLFDEKIAFLFFNNNVYVVGVLSVIAVVECLYYYTFNYFRATQQIKKYSLITIFKEILKITFLALAIYLNKGINGVAIGFLLSSMICLCINVIIIFFQIGVIIPKFKNLKEHLSFGIPTIPQIASQWLVNSSDRYIIALFLGTTYVGYYSPSYSIGYLISMLFMPLSFLLPSFLSEYYDQGNIKEVNHIINYSLKYYLTIAIPAVFGLSLLAKPLLINMSTVEIAQNSSLIIPIVAISTLILGVLYILQQIIVLEKRTKLLGKIWILAALLNLGLNYLLIPYFGIIVAAITTFASFSVSTLISLRYISRSFNLYLDFYYIGKIFVSSLIMSLVILYIDPIKILELFVTVISCALLYFLLMYVLKAFEKQEVELIKKLLYKFQYVYVR
jgi:O-antigen/teichoic acid export membrane protein